MVAVKNVLYNSAQGAQNSQTVTDVQNEGVFLNILGNLTNKNYQQDIKKKAVAFPERINQLVITEEDFGSSDLFQEEKSKKLINSNVHHAWMIPVTQTIVHSQESYIDTERKEKTTISKWGMGHQLKDLEALAKIQTNRTADILLANEVPQTNEWMQMLTENVSQELQKANTGSHSFQEVSQWDIALDKEQVREKPSPNIGRDKSFLPLKEPAAQVKTMIAAGQRKDHLFERIQPSVCVENSQAFIRSSKEKKNIRVYTSVMSDQGQGEKFTRIGKLFGQLDTKRYTNQETYTSNQITNFEGAKLPLEVAQSQMISDSPIITHASVYMQIHNKIIPHLKGNGAQKIQMKLYPEGLGEIQVTLICKDDTVSLDILTNNAITQKILESQSGELRDALLTKNYEVPTLNISTQSESFQGSNHGFSFFEGNTGSSSKWQNERQPAFEGIDLMEGNVESLTRQNRQFVSSGRINFWV
jgi:hypothetical protein